MNILTEAARMQAAFEAQMRETGKEAISTLYSDFTIADRMSEDAVEDTFERSKEWLKNYKMWTELVIVLNWKILEWHDKAGKAALKGNDETPHRMARCYDRLWREAEDMFYTEYEDNEEVNRYYYEMTD